MSVKQIIEYAKELTPGEKALIAHYLISSLETRQDENVDDLWADLAEKRYNELKSGKVRPVSWEEIKNKVRS